MNAQRLLVLGLLACCPFSAPATAAEEPRSHRDFVFLASDRPILIRFHLRSSGRPFTEPWEEYTAKLFAYCDSDSNGALEKKEAARIPHASFLLNHLQGNIVFYDAAQVAPLQEVDANKDGKVALPEFRSYYRKQQFVPLRYSFDVQSDTARRITDRMYKFLDEDADGLLSEAELARAPEALRKVDTNEDEMIVAAELGGAGNAGDYVVLPAPGIRVVASPTASPRALFRVGPGSTQPFGRWLFQQYDQDKNGRLTLAEIGLPEEDAAGLDTNKDGSLDVTELEGFALRKPDVELSALAGDVSKGSLAARFLRGVGLTDGPDRLAVYNPDKRPMPLAARGKRANSSTWVFTWGDAEVEIQVSSPRGSDPFQGVRNYYLRQFRQAAGKEEEVDRKKAMQDYALRGMFVFADANSDDKLTEKELLSYLDVQQGGSTCVVVLSASDRGRNLLEALDADEDTRLSPREFLEGWRRLRPDAKVTRGFDRGEMPRRFRVVVGQGQVYYNPVPPPSRKDGSFFGGPPTWFTQMDRNGDGDISSREFLGTEADFRKLDADGDGLLSPAEARKGEKTAD